MISSLSGTVRHKDLNALVVDVGGVGYKVLATSETTLNISLNSPIFLWIHMVVRETAMELFGFLDREGLETFELLITISGIGPRTALGILNVASPATLRQAVASADTTYLTRVSGIGKKNAEKIVLELKDKLKILESDTSMNSLQAKDDSDAMEALISLGYSERDAREALKKIPKNLEGAPDRVKAALKSLGTR